MRYRPAAIVLVLSFVAAACGSSGSPSAPSSSTPTPTPTTVSLTGRVSDQGGTAINGALVHIDDGPNAGKSTNTDSGGNYSIGNLTQGNGNVSASAANYNLTTKGVFINGTNTLNFQLQTTVAFSRSGNGNDVFTIPSYISKVRITGTYTANSSNFVVWNGPPNTNCDGTINVNCHLVVNDLIGTGWGKTVSDGVYLVSQNGFQIILSTGVAWTLTEQR